MKSFLSFDDQLKLLKTRHLHFKSETEAKEILKTENYYRLSGYFKMFTKPGTDDFVEGLSMKKLMKIYRFDEQLRTILTEYLGRVEIASKTRIAYNLAKVSFPTSYSDSSYFINSHYHSQFMDKVHGEIKHDAKNPIIKRFKGEAIPIWAIVEVLTFGTVSKMFANLKPHFKSHCKIT